MGIPKDIKRRLKIIKNLKISTLFDIGANKGQYAKLMRKLGYTHKIISFEPLKEEFQDLRAVCEEDDNWFAYQYALGRENTTSVINIAGNSYSSSILNMLTSHLQSAPESAYVGTEEIKVKSLDAIFDSFYSAEDKVMLKIDTQGYEKHVLDGASESLKRTELIQVEMSIIPLYQSEMLLTDMIVHLDGLGFQLVSLENGFEDPITSQLLQVDGLFVNKRSLINNKL